MKRLSGMILISLMAVFIFAIDAGAGSYDLSPDPSDLWDLSHGRYYTWGINDLVLSEGETITSASLTFTNIRNTDPPSSDLYVHLLDNVAVGAHSRRDHDSKPGDQFSYTSWVNRKFNQGQRLFFWEDVITTTPQTLTYDFDDSDLALLLEYSDFNNFGLGFDPDCHFKNDGISLKIETRIAQIPEPCTTLLLGSSLLGFAAFMRRVRKKRS